MTIRQKLTTSIAAATLLFGVFVPTALAQTNIQISGNSATSSSRVETSSNSISQIIQNSIAEFSNIIHITSLIGDNTAQDNTGGNVFVQTSDTASAIHISNQTDQPHLEIRHEASDPAHNISIIHTWLSGDQEIPGPGEAAGSGRALVSINQEKNLICIHMEVSNLKNATAAHIHKARRREAGPIVVNLPPPDQQGISSGCLNIDQSELINIHEHPEEYYLNVHSEDYPNGAVRGQLAG